MSILKRLIAVRVLAYSYGARARKYWNIVALLPYTAYCLRFINMIHCYERLQRRVAAGEAEEYSPIGPDRYPCGLSSAIQTSLVLLLQ